MNFRRLTALSFAAGAVDAVSFYQLGRIFTANMTGNVVLLGLSAGHGGTGETLRSAIALTGYVCSALMAFRLTAGASGWDRPVVSVLWAEALLLAGFAAGWAVRLPLGVLVLVAAVAMGLQSAAVNRVGDSGISTTYITGTLTALLGQLAEAARQEASAVRRLSVVVALVVGAAVAGVLQTVRDTLAALLPVVVVLMVLVDLEWPVVKRWPGLSRVRHRGR
jgi:uncharacterized membrane protein YoaK (UPF0700 family)